MFDNLIRILSLAADCLDSGYHYSETQLLAIAPSPFPLPVKGEGTLRPPL